MLISSYLVSIKPLLLLLSRQSYIQDSRPWKGIYCEASSALISFMVLNCSSIPCWTNHLATTLALSDFESISWRFSVLACCIRSLNCLHSQGSVEVCVTLFAPASCMCIAVVYLAPLLM